MTMAEPGRETAFSMRWNALKTKAENATKELAANLQEQRDKFVESRVKAQAEKAATRSAGEVRSSSIDTEQHEEALRIVQYQNKALRDRLRSTAAENERLHEMLKEYRRRKEEGEDPAAELGGVLSTVPQLEQQIQLLRESVTAAEEVAVKKEAQYVQELERVKAEAEVVRGELESALAVERKRLEEATRDKNALEEAIERERSEAASKKGLDQVESREQHAEPDGPSEMDGVKELREQVEQQEVEIGRLRAILKAVTEERDIARADVDKYQVEASASLMKAQKEVELLQGLLDGAKTAERESREEAQRLSVAHSEKEAEATSMKALVESLTEERDALRRETEASKAKETGVSPEVGTSEPAAFDTEAFEHVQEELRILRERHDASVLALEEKTAALDALNATLDETRNAADASSRALANLAQKEGEWMSKHAQLEAHVADLTSQVDALVVKGADAARVSASQLEELETRLGTQAAEIEALTAEKSKLEHLLVEKTTDTGVSTAETEAIAELEARKAEVETLKTKLAESEQANRDALEHKRQTASKLDQLQSMIASGAKSVDEMRRMQALLVEKDEEIKRLVNAAEAHRAQPASPPPPSYDSVMGAENLSLKIERLEKEIEDLQRSQKRNDHGVDVEYLAAVLRQSFACGELDAKSPIFGVIATLLHFTEGEIQEIHKHSADKSSDKIESILPDLSSVTETISKSLSLR